MKRIKTETSHHYEMGSQILCSVNGHFRRHHGIIEKPKPVLFIGTSHESIPRQFGADLIRQSRRSGKWVES